MMGMIKEGMSRTLSKKGMSKGKKMSDLYTLGDVLGAGAFGQVLAGISKADGEKVAVKIINLKLVNEEDMEAIENEVAVMKDLRHPQIVQFIASIRSKSKLYIVMEFVSGGELFDAIIEREIFSENEVRGLMVNLMGAIDYMHKRSVIHQDIKCENLLLSNPNDLSSVKIADFGLAIRFNKGQEELSQEACGTLGFLAPEVIKGKPHGKPVDLWACGVIMYILVTGRHPFDIPNADGSNMEAKQVFVNILTSDENTIPPDYLSNESKEFMARLLDPEADTRITSDEALKHPWFGIAQENVNKENMPEMIPNLKNYNAYRKLVTTFATVVAIHGLAARHIQRLTRGHFARREIKKLEDNALKIQSLARGRSARTGKQPVLATHMRYSVAQLNSFHQRYQDMNLRKMSLSKKQFLQIFDFKNDEEGGQCHDELAIGLPECDMFVCFACAALLATGTADEKLGFVFSTFDFNEDQTLSLDELTILMCVSERAVRVLSGQKDPPVLMLEQITQKAFDSTNIATKGAISLEQFVAFAKAEKEVGNFFKRIRKAYDESEYDTGRRNSIESVTTS
jgi:calcium/calmodulin-dependent protein kinase I